jgi:hypothetical protein
VLFVFLGASAGSLTDSAQSGEGNMTVTIIVVVVGVESAGYPQGHCAIKTTVVLKT